MAIGQVYGYSFDVNSSVVDAGVAAVPPSSFHAYCDRDAVTYANR